MSPAVILFGSLLLFILLGFAISHSFVLSVIITTMYMDKTAFFATIAQRVVLGMDSFPLLAVPFFILSGALMEASGISTRLVSFLRMILRRVPAATSCITVGASAFFGAISGSAAATTSAIGGVVTPTMREIGYENKDISAVTGCAGILGVLIPPSVPLMTYAIAAQASVGDMFIAGILPGLVLMVVFMIVSIVLYGKVEKGNKEKMAWKERLDICVNAIAAIIMPVIVLGGIYGGIFTATEAAAVSVIYALFVGFLLYRKLTFKKIVKLLYDSAVTTACIFFMIGCSSAFTWLLASTGLSQQIASALISMFHSKIVILLIVNLILLFLGCFMDTIAIILLMTPVLLPVFASIGASPIQLGVILVLNTALGMITPPLGANLLLSSQLCGMRSMTPALKHAMIYVAAGLVVLALFTYVPALSTIFL